MKFEAYLAALLRPLGVYDLRRGTLNRGELAAYGARLDHAEGELDETEREMSLCTAEGFGLERIEALLPYRPVCETAQQRRAALAALLRIGGDSFTPEGINDTLRGCGLNARAEEGAPPLLDKAAQVREEQKKQKSSSQGGYTVTGEGDPAVDTQVMARYEAKKAKNFAEADRIRDELKAQGIEVTDVPGGAVWKRI